MLPFPQVDLHFAAPPTTGVVRYTVSLTSDSYIDLNFHKELKVGAVYCMLINSTLECAIKLKLVYYTILLLLRSPFQWYKDMRVHVAETYAIVYILSF